MSILEPNNKIGCFFVYNTLQPKGAKNRKTDIKNRKEIGRRNHFSLILQPKETDRFFVVRKIILRPKTVNWFQFFLILQSKRRKSVLKSVPTLRCSGPFIFPKWPFNLVRGRSISCEIKSGYWNERQQIIQFR